MSGNTSVPTISFTATGFVPPAESAVVTGLQADWAAAFGGSLNTTAPAPAGSVITSEAAIIGDNNNQQCTLFNSVDPAYAFGRMQDAIGRIYFMTRIPATSTTISVTCTGLVGVVIPVNAQIQDPSGNIYLSTQTGTIPSSGSINLPFACAATGPIPIPETVSIYQAIPNWNTVAVVADSGVLGANVESRAAFELRRQQSVASNASGFTQAILGAVLAVSGVTDAYVIDNYTTSDTLTGGVTISANSIYVCVAGTATEAAIAFAIWSKKSPGCAYTGNTSVTVQDPNPAYQGSGPTYTVKYQAAVNVPISFTVTLQTNSGIPSNAALLIAGAIQQAFTGADNGSRAKIGSLLLASRYYAGIIALGSWAQLLSVTLGTGVPPACAFTGAISTTTLTVSAVTSATFTGTGSGTNLTASSVTGTIYPGYIVTGTGVPSNTTIVSQTSGTPGGAGVYVTSQATTSSGASLTAEGVLAVGQFLYDATGDLAAGTYITALESGTGGTGTYTVSVSQTVGSEAMTCAAPTQTFVQMGISQEPTFNAGSSTVAPDVNVVLAAA